MSKLVSPICTIIVPIGPNQGDFSNLSEWLLQVDPTKVQVILVLDSIEDTRPLIDDVIQRFSFVEALEAKCRNPGGAKNLGLEEAIGQWIIFCDSDDLLLYENVMETIMESGAKGYKVLCGGFYAVFNENRIMQPHPSKLDDLVADPGCWRLIFCRDRIFTHRFPQSRMGEDLVFLASMNLLEHEVFFSMRPHYVYEMDIPSQLTRQNNAGEVLAATVNELPQIKTMTPFSRRIAARLILSAIKNIRSEDGLRSIMRIRKDLLSNFFQLVPWILLLISSHKRRKSHYSVVILTGGLGNQLFQYAYVTELANVISTQLDVTTGSLRVGEQGQPELLTLDLPLKFQVKNIHPLSLRRRSCNLSLRMGYRRSHNHHQLLDYLLRFCINALNSLLEGRRTHVRSPNNLGWDPEFSIVASPTTVFGYFQSPRYWSNETVRLLHTLRPASISQEAQEWITRAIEEGPIIVHIRRGDYLQNDEFGTLASSYYSEALDSIQDLLEAKPSVPIWVFSDSEFFAEQVMKNLNVVFRIVPTASLNTSETLEIMRHGKGYIIANSSFSWWGAFLRKDQRAPVIAPSPWFRELTGPEALLPKDWVKLPSVFESSP